MSREVCLFSGTFLEFSYKSCWRDNLPSWRLLEFPHKEEVRVFRGSFIVKESFYKHPPNVWPCVLETFKNFLIMFKLDFPCPSLFCFFFFSPETRRIENTHSTSVFLDKMTFIPDLKYFYFSIRSLLGFSEIPSRSLGVTCWGSVIILFGTSPLIVIHEDLKS